MADIKKVAAPSAKKEVEIDYAGGEYATFAEEDAEDNRFLKYSMGAAALFHIILLAIHLPEMVAEAKTEEKQKKVYVVQQVRFQPPPPKATQEIPKVKAKKIPIPDPTPDEPEPIRLEEPEPEVDLPDVDSIIFGIPDAPPAVAEEMPDGPIQVGGDVSKPEKLSAPDPQYTEIARKARIQGVVIVQAIIDKEGNVTNVKILKGLPMGLSENAMDAIKKWKFKPATLNGKPVDVYYNLTVNFRLQ
jgi:periplasmic protein TonB